MLVTVQSMGPFASASSLSRSNQLIIFSWGELRVGPRAEHLRVTELSVEGSSGKGEPLLAHGFVSHPKCRPVSGAGVGLLRKP